MKLKKLIGALLLSMLCSSSALFSLEQSVKPNCCKGPVLCPTNPIYEKCDDCCHRLHLDIGLIYYQPAIFGTHDIAENFQATSLIVEVGQPAFDCRRYFTPCMNYSLGLTASAGYLMEHDDWFVGADFDWLSSTKKSSKSDSSAIYSNPYFAAVIGTLGAGTKIFTGIDNTQKIDLYDLSLRLSRSSYHSRCYGLEPFMGVHALWYNTSNANAYYNTAETTFTRGAYSTYQNNWAVGPMFGLNGEYYVTHDFSLFSDSKISIMYGYSSVETKLQTVDTTVTAGVNEKYNFVGNSSYFYSLSSIIGIKLGRYCLDDLHYVAVKLGYKAERVVSSNSMGYGLGGLYANFSWDF